MNISHFGFILLKLSVEKATSFFTQNKSFFFISTLLLLQDKNVRRSFSEFEHFKPLDKKIEKIET